MSMSKKHYYSIALLLNEVAPELDSEHFVWLVDSLANQFKSDNPNFDRERFLAEVWRDFAEHKAYSEQTEDDEVFCHYCKGDLEDPTDYKMRNGFPSCWECEG